MTISTVHSAKGCEWSHVFICSAVDGRFPNAKAKEEGGDGGIEEEKRLMYVTITRAKVELIITWPHVESAWSDDLEDVSCFLEDVHHLVETSKKRKKLNKNKGRNFDFHEDTKTMPSKRINKNNTYQTSDKLETAS